MQKNVPYFVKLRVTNCAGGSIIVLSSPFLIDDTKPVPGVVVDGTDFQEDVLWFGDPHQVQGNGKNIYIYIIILFSLINYKPSLSIKWFAVNLLR